MRLVVLFVTSVLILIAQSAWAMKPFTYVEDFEGNNPVAEKPWAVGAKYTVNYQGLTDERAHSGSKSYKIDVTFESGSYLYFAIPISIPVQGKMKFSAYIFIPEENKGKAGVGLNFVLPPTPNSGCSPLNQDSFSTTNGEWKYVEGDLLTEGNRAARVITSYMWGVDGDQLENLLSAGQSPVGIVADKIGLFLMGDKQRIVMYVDDIKIEGEAPDQETYKANYMARWNEIQKKIETKRAAWNKELDSTEKSLKRRTNIKGDALNLKTEALNFISTVRERIASTQNAPYLEIKDQIFVDGAIKQIAGMTKSVPELASGKMKLTDLRMYVVPPVTSNKILPNDLYVPGSVTDTISISACPGEITAASFVLRPSKDMTALKASAGILKSRTDTIQAANVDIKMVKCWYQAGSAWYNIGQAKDTRILVPELLLNDASLVRVDYDKERNYLTFGSTDPSKHVWISDTAPPKEDFLSYKIEDFPVKDAATLQSIALKADTNQQYWITFNVPADTKSGTYSGQIQITEAGREIAVVKVKLNVRPFTLDPPFYTSSIYYRGTLSNNWKDGSIGSEYKSEKQLYAELKNLIDHGVDSPTIYQSYSNKELLGKYLDLYRKAGWKGNTIYFLGIQVGSFKFTTPEGLENLKSACVDLKTFVKPYGIDEVYIYGIDEATGDVLASQRNAFATAHEAGVKLFVAGYRGTFESVGDVLDLLVFAGNPSSEEAEKWHSINHNIWSYANPQGGVENPEINRRNFGLLIWSRNFDGSCTYAYQHAFGDIWNDFDHATYRDHNFTYPTVDGVIDTIAWEGYREGVNDVKYLTTLLNSIEQAKSKGKTSAVNAAQRYLQSIDFQYGDLDEIRENMAKHIINLKK